ncbi:hypothetical protein N7466_008522 [Penicillium verhagenii]|uniref:uncharacterized protein n=1 Tax=Penicillium verhagenii TaxID=1562060 RepID=UPI002545873B|nr:uncharacterized protein N7466_008522 [Penicillium verhagenii]KAJ5924335.1 hypothetical protein N7466_008522 [Penicillium verhagenii]
MTEQLLVGKTCLVTGGAGGLGKAIATKYLEAGANVVICDINEDRLQQTSAELSTKGPFKAIKTDITSQSEVEALFEQIIQEFGKIDVLVNNAGIMDRFDGAADLDPELWNRVIAINLTAPFLLSKLAVRNMLEQEKPQGRIINIVSIAGKAGGAAGAAYTASKHGVVGLTKNTAAFYGDKGIRCNALMMGAMNTNIADAMRSGCNMEGMKRCTSALQAIGLPFCDLEDAAELSLYLAGGKGFGIVNGGCISADNGWSAMVG